MRSVSYFCVLALAFVIGAVSADDAYASKKKAYKSAYAPKYSELVMDADTGAVLYEKNGYAERYPASLTKMMTLYMLFDALERGQMNLDTKMPVSNKAASQPKTNINLHSGESIRAEDAIKAMVVHSANDVAVVIAEAVGRSEWNFARMMTEKAKSLGMKNTVFHNASGLPDTRQHTTAYDMAVLGRALRKDFPQYYPYFNVQEFVWEGVPYRGHNRVLGRFSGADGIKTGYINASGFNLVTSAQRPGFNAVGVVMGGRSGRSRDDRMVAMLTDSHTQWADLKRGTATTQVASNIAVPVPTDHPYRAEVKPAKVAKVISVEQALKEREEERVVAAPAIQVSMRETPPAKEAPSFSLNLVSDAYASVETASHKQVSALPPQHTLDYQLAVARQIDAKPSNWTEEVKAWGVQVGAFVNEKQARDAVKKAYTLARNELKNAYVTISEQPQSRRTIHRARLGNLSKEEADAACAKLEARNQDCLALQIN